MEYRFSVGHKELTEAEALERLQQYGAVSVTYFRQDGSYDTVHVHKYRTTFSSFVLYVVIHDRTLTKLGTVAYVTMYPEHAIDIAKRMAQGLEWSVQDTSSR